MEVLRLSQVPDDQILRKNVHFSLSSDELVKVRTFIFSDQKIFQLDDEESVQNCKPTLLMLHGFGCNACYTYQIYKGLVEHFRVISIDMLGYGSSSRVHIDDEFF